MAFAFASFLLVGFGVEFAAMSARRSSDAAARAEVISGSLLALGLMLLGAGLQFSFA